MSCSEAYEFLIVKPGDHVVIRNEKPVDPEVLIEFYKKMGRVVKNW